MSDMRMYRGGVLNRTLKSLLRWSILIFVGCFLSMHIASSVFACSPLPGYPHYTPLERAISAHTVVEGIVIRTSWDATGNFQQANVAVITYFKNDGASSISVTGLGAGSLCLASVEEGSRLIFYLSRLSDTEFEAHYLEPHDAIAQPTKANRNEIVAAVRCVEAASRKMANAKGSVNLVYRHDFEFDPWPCL